MTIRSSDWTGLSLAAGRYQVAAKLGEGGMGSVYRALDRNINAEVVIKVPHPAMLSDPEFAARFTREIRSLVKLSHPRIVKVTDVGERQGLPFAVMQYLPGGSLEDRQARTPGGCDPRDVHGWLSGVADALDYVHSQGYVHRDVKPGNILFDAHGHSFLSDFGVAKVLVSSGDGKPTSRAQTAVTGAGMVLGTPEYMAPELIMGDPFDGRADQYALAVTVYELLCGRRPFEDETKTKILVLHTTKPPPAPDLLRPTLPARLSQAILKGLAKDPGARYPSCAALAAAVAGASEAVPTVSPERVRIRCRSCDKVLSVDAAVLARMKQSGRSVPCPSCQAPISVAEAPAAGLSGSGITRGGTVLLSSTGSAGSAPAPREAGVTPGGTTIFATSRAAPATTPEVASTVKTVAPAKDEVDVAPGRARLALISAGSFAALAVFSLGLLWSPSGGKEKPTVALAGATVTPAASVSTHEFTGKQEPPKTPTAVEPSASTPARPPVLPALSNVVELPAKVENPEPPPPVVRIPDAAPPLEHLPDPKPGPEMAVATVSGKPSEPAPVEEPEEDRAPPPNDNPGSPPPVGKLGRGAVTLDKLLAAPKAYAGQLVVPLGAYGLGDVAAFRPDGSVGVSVIRSDLHYIPKSDTITVRRSTVTDLDMDRRLADRLVFRGKLRRAYVSDPSPSAWNNEVAILTVQVLKDRVGTPGGRSCLIVKAEFFERFDMKIVPSGFSKKLKVAYNTYTVTPDGDSRGLGDPDDWQDLKQDRLFHVYNQFQMLFKSMMAQKSMAQWNQFQSMVNQTVARGTSAAALQQGAIRAQEAAKIGAGR